MNDNNLIIITGASRGIGKAIAEKLLEEGYTLLGISRKCTSCDLSHPNFYREDIDLEDLDKLPEKLKIIQKNYPIPYGIVCNAGRGLLGNLEEYSYQQMRSLIDLNFLSQAFLVKNFLPLLKKKKKGKILFIGSEAGIEGKRQGTLYCASKFALRGFVQALQDECSTSGIAISLINPGMVKSDFFKKLSISPGDEDNEHLLPEDIATFASLIFSMREGALIEEVNLSPQRKVIKRKKNRSQ